MNIYKESDRNFLINIFLIIKNRGYQLKFISNLLKKYDLPISPDGLSCYNPIKKNFIILIDDTQVIQRIRYTVSHELGHIEFGDKEESLLANTIANYFAGYLDDFNHREPRLLTAAEYNEFKKYFVGIAYEK